MKKINILDCTLRDGGYYNNWDFSKDLVNDYLKAISESGIKNIEIGFDGDERFPHDFTGQLTYPFKEHSTK